uniref:Death domain-containing protein n=1 Tax=Branchiostoma floridae TaxID=7739 RepID=C3Y8H5_BRAFL|eukprot:XP_002607402.1 hypothetical protein BRAFLDRAFT_69811 [Branchiostoma floridae]
MAQKDVHKYFFYVKEKVSSDWKDLAFHLGLEQPDINSIEGRNRDDKSRCMDLLEEWLKRNRERATIEVLMEALSEANLQSVVDGLTKDLQEILSHDVWSFHTMCGNSTHCVETCTHRVETPHIVWKLHTSCGNSTHRVETAICPMAIDEQRVTLVRGNSPRDAQRHYVSGVASRVGRTTDIGQFAASLNVPMS